MCNIGSSTLSFTLQFVSNCIVIKSVTFSGTVNRIDDDVVDVNCIAVVVTYADDKMSVMVRLAIPSIAIRFMVDSFGIGRCESSNTGIAAASYEMGTDVWICTISINCFASVVADDIGIKTSFSSGA